MNKDRTQEILKKIVNDFGEDIFSNKNRSQGLISDYFASEIKTKKLLGNAIRENLPKKLLDIKNLNEIEKETNIGKIKYYYKEENGLDEITANFVVESFIYAFEVLPSIHTTAAGRINQTHKVADNLPKKIFNTDDIEKYKKNNVVVIPYGFTEIAYGAFWNCENLTSIIIPSSVTKIESEAFYWCHRLTSIIVPEGVTSIEKRALYSCNNLLEITLPDSLTSIEKEAIGYCPKLKRIRCKKGSYAEKYILENLLENLLVYTDSENDVFYNIEINNMSPVILDKSDIKKYITENNITHEFDFVIPEGIKIIDDYAFENCRLLKSIVIPNSVEHIGYYAFNDCKLLKSVVIPNSVECIGRGAFCGCSSLENINIPFSVSIIPLHAFLGCFDLKELVLPRSIIRIDDHAFDGCMSLRITIPDSVKVFGESALQLYEKGDMVDLRYRLNELRSIFSEKQDVDVRRAAVLCKRGSYAEKYLLQNSLDYLIEYM
jgi:hypothetical protein